MRRVLGIDEAGRGCVFGDLVVGAFFVEALDDEGLRAAGAADSKKLTHARRIAARQGLASLGTGVVTRIAPSAIDAGNLNHLEEAAIVALIQRFEPEHVYIDALGHPSTLPATEARLRAALGGLAPRFTIEPKADHTYAVVGAASIFAKTHRDEALEAHAAVWGELGSGYPSDPRTRAWLASHAQTREPWPAFVRTRWQTVRDLAQGALL
ncbi:MAG: ribonuclease HII [Alphaproteobacteria bacterium]|nr:ribonuclease HII [Alphaproteobacteria bacterium]MCB9694901.1 ribonuclease HII [Alphaproteobacteria bacterium]